MSTRVDVVDMVHQVLTCLVDEESAIHLNVVEGDANVVIEVRLAPCDYGKVIGKAGAHVKALRLLLAAASRKYRRTFTLSVVDGHNGDHTGPPDAL